LTNLGLDILDEGAHPQWQFEYVELENELVEKLVDRIESCRILLQMIERYTPDELNSITQIIVDQIPLNFTYQEAVDYQTDYYKALINFKKEFKQEKKPLGQIFGHPSRRHPPITIGKGHDGTLVRW
jgi:hypothetical protein